MSRRKKDTESEIITYFEEQPIATAVMMLKIVRGRVEKRQRIEDPAAAPRAVGRPRKRRNAQQPEMMSSSIPTPQEDFASV